MKGQQIIAYPNVIIVGTRKNKYAPGGMTYKIDCGIKEFKNV